MATRESDLYKDKVEVSLDGRQIFYLFFGGAVIVGIVFVLGVLVGRRVEARGHVDRARTNASADPLAALDRLDGSDAMAFRGSLSGKDSVAPVDKEIAELSKERGIVKPAAPAKAAEEPVVEKKKSEEKKSEEPVVEKKKSEEKKSEEKKSEEKKSDDKNSLAKSEKKGDDKKSEAKVEEKKPERFTLQLSSFQDKAEAEAYLATVKGQGYTAQITQAKVEGKGTFYRIRMGSYKSLDSANTAKTDFEKSGRSASVMKL